MSDLLYIIPSFPHLHDVELIVAYKEVPQPSDVGRMKAPGHWKSDPDSARYLGFAPGGKFYRNGVLIRENNARPAQTSKTPFPEKRVPRRGLQQVYPDDPEYARICREQGLEYLLQHHHRQKSPSLPNGVHPSPPMSHEEAVLETAMATTPPPNHVDGPGSVPEETNGAH